MEEKEIILSLAVTLPAPVAILLHVCHVTQKIDYLFFTWTWCTADSLYIFHKGILLIVCNPMQASASNPSYLFQFNYYQSNQNSKMWTPSNQIHDAPTLYSEDYMHMLFLCEKTEATDVLSALTIGCGLIFGCQSMAKLEPTHSYTGSATVLWAPH